MIRLPHSEYNITTACQNSCVACNHFNPLQERWHKDPEVVKHDFELAAKLLHFHDMCIIGGEPTLHPRLLEILDITRNSGITDRVKVNTNGQNAERWPDDLYRKTDHLQVSPYKLTAEEKFRLKIKCAEFNVELEWQDLGFRKVGYKVADAERGRRLFQNCWYRHNRHVIEDGYFYYCCVGRWIPETLLGKSRTSEAIALEGLTEERLKEFLGATEPPASCAVCCSNMGEMIGWSEEKDKVKWLDKTLG
jgi:cyclic pyranopterin phosphate synthase